MGVLDVESFDEPSRLTEDTILLRAPWMTCWLWRLRCDLRDSSPDNPCTRSFSLTGVRTALTRLEESMTVSLHHERTSPVLPFVNWVRQSASRHTFQHHFLPDGAGTAGRWS